jgi:hypothetical protein
VEPIRSANVLADPNYEPPAPSRHATSNEIATKELWKSHGVRLNSATNSRQMLLAACALGAVRVGSRPGLGDDHQGSMAVISQGARSAAVRFASAAVTGNRNSPTPSSLITRSSIGAVRPMENEPCSAWVGPKTLDARAKRTGDSDCKEH